MIHDPEYDSANEPSRAMGLRRRWAIALCAVGWLVMVYDAWVRSGGPGIATPFVWGTGCLFAACASIRLWVRPSENALVVVMGVSTVIGATRSAAYLTEGIWSALGVWTIVMGLLAVAYTRPLAGIR